MQRFRSGFLSSGRQPRTYMKNRRCYSFGPMTKRSGVLGSWSGLQNSTTTTVWKHNCIVVSFF